MFFPQLLSSTAGDGYCNCHWLFFGVNVFIIISVASAIPKDVTDKKEADIVGCLPASQRFILTSYFNKHDVLVDSEYEKFLAKDFQLIGSREELLHKGSYYTPKLSINNRDLNGEGSHRHLVTSVVLDIDSASYRHHFESCEVVVVERLPLGIFADTFELQRLAQRGVFSDVAVFGDTNLELPSALSNRSTLEIHMRIRPLTISGNSRRLGLAILLPLHVRYPPLDSGSYWDAKFGEPDLLISCIPAISFSDNCSSLLVRFYPNDANDLVWKIPCGNDEHTTMVSVITFASALVSALLLVYCSVSLSKKHIKVA